MSFGFWENVIAKPWYLPMLIRNSTNNKHNAF